MGAELLSERSWSLPIPVLPITQLSRRSYVTAGSPEGHINQRIHHEVSPSKGYMNAIVKGLGHENLNGILEGHDFLQR